MYMDVLLLLKLKLNCAQAQAQAHINRRRLAHDNIPHLPSLPTSISISVPPLPLALHCLTLPYLTLPFPLTFTQAITHLNFLQAIDKPRYLDSHLHDWFFIYITTRREYVRYGTLPPFFPVFFFFLPVLSFPFLSFPFLSFLSLFFPATLFPSDSEPRTIKLLAVASRSPRRTTSFFIPSFLPSFFLSFFPSSSEEEEEEEEDGDLQVAK